MATKREHDTWAAMQQRLEASWKEITHRADAALQKAQDLALQARQRMDAELADLRSGTHVVQERMKNAGQEWKAIRKDLEKAANDLVAASKALQKAAAKAVTPGHPGKSKRGKVAKKSAKKGTKTGAKKTAKKTGRAAPKKTTKKGAKKSAKKSVKKGAKKTGRAAPKKAAKKSAKKAVRKRGKAAAGPSPSEGAAAMST